MSVTVGQWAFTTGEVAPSLFGRPDLARFHAAASTMRNMVVNYRGGSYSRAGTALVGFSKQTGRSWPPRVIGYQFSINQGLSLEFGNFYMRVVSNGAFVTNAAIPISNISQANPGVLTASAYAANSATANILAVASAYAPGDTVTLAGGSPVTPTVLAVTTTTLVSTQVNAPGTIYAPGDTITLVGGTQTSTAQVTVAQTRVVSATVFSSGSGGTNGTQTVTGTTGTGVPFQASVTVAGGTITAVLSITSGGSYSANPTAHDPVVGASLTGAVLAVVVGVNAVSVTSPGIFTANPSGLAFTQASTSGSGTGATFSLAVLGPYAVSVLTPGVYGTSPSNPALQASTSGFGTGATFTVVYAAVAPFSTGDWLFFSGVGGMTQINQGTFVATQLTPSTFALYDVYGTPLDTTAFSPFTAGGTVASIYTLPTIYSEQDLAYLKFTQSADVMSIVCVNQQTFAEYPPQDLTRVSDTDWSFAVVNAAPTVAAPAGTPTVVASTTGTTNYAYVVTAVSPSDGTESIASAIGGITGAVDIAATVGTLTISWNSVPGVNQYNVYKATPSYDTPVPGGALFGYAGTAYGTRFVDNNIVADFTQVPPTHSNPFARGQAVSATLISGGSGYTTATAAVVSATGSGAVFNVVVNTTLTPGSGEEVVTPGPVSGLILVDGGVNYTAGDQLIISGDGSGAVASLTIGPQTGTYPAVATYFQQRRAYGYTLNNPDTYFMSQPGAYTNFDSRIPTIATDAIIGTPWSLQVNGIQWMLPTTPGLLVMTGEAAWLMAGAGSFATNVQALTPASQNAIPQAFSGCSATVPPQKVNYSLLYVEQKGSLYYELPYQLYALSEPIDLTENSSHLFVGYSIREHAWCEQPNKILWSVRNDGVLLSLTYLKAQQISGWARNDTQGSFVSVCAVTEPPVDALYLATQRFPGGKTAYMIERMDNRIWSSVENCWCVDAGLSLAQPAPSASLTAGSATGLGALTGVTGLVGGAGYSSSTYAYVVDANGSGPGTGATAALTIAGGVVTAVTFSPAGSKYQAPALVIVDPQNTGSGASAHITLDNSATFVASAAVFSLSSVGSVIRSGGGIARITAYTSPTQVTANILSPVVQTIPNSGGVPQIQTAGNWTLTAPVSTISGLDHLIGATVTGLADGNVIPPTVVSATGTITLSTPASAVIVGLGFTAQLQGLYLEAGEPTVQGQRKKIAAVTARVEASRGITMSTNQPDGSVQSPQQIAPTWGLQNPMAAVPDKAVRPYNALATPLYTGDVRIPVPGGDDVRGQVALQQANPLPMQVLAFVSEVSQGDVPEIKASPRQQQRGK